MVRKKGVSYRSEMKHLRSLKPWEINRIDKSQICMCFIRIPSSPALLTMPVVANRHAPRILLLILYQRVNMTSPRAAWMNEFEKKDVKLLCWALLEDDQRIQVSQHPKRIRLDHQIRIKNWLWSFDTFISTIMAPYFRQVKVCASSLRVYKIPHAFHSLLLMYPRPTLASIHWLS